MNLLKLLVCGLFFLMSVTAFSQMDSVKVLIEVTNKAENESWLDKLESLSDKQQLEVIRQRLLRDTTTYDSTSSYFRGQQFYLEFYCRPFIKVNGQDVFLDSSTQTKAFIELLNDSHIVNVEVLKSDKAIEQYGKYGLCGMLLINSSDKTILDKLKKI